MAFDLADLPMTVLKLLEDKAKQFKEFRDGNRKLLNWISPVVNVVHTLSGVLGAAVTLVPFGPAKAIFAGCRCSHRTTGVTSSYDALVDLFECLGNFLSRLRIYTDLPLTHSMAEITVKIMVELLSVLALATKQIKQGRFSEDIRKEAARRKRDRKRATQAGPSHTRGRSDDYGVTSSRRELDLSAEWR
ncbi:hypothetical protein H4582DRAFT_2080087 [Lactarius indigo]|nr:hypothetical protein H4582DRAFT_2080087 [Lactarius indigo]